MREKGGHLAGLSHFLPFSPTSSHTLIPKYCQTYIHPLPNLFTIHFIIQSTLNYKVKYISWSIGMFVLKGFGIVFPALFLKMGALFYQIRLMMIVYGCLEEALVLSPIGETLNLVKF